MSILIIEDDQDIAELVAFNIQQEGYTHHWAATGTQGLQALASQSFDLVILDLNLPDQSGLEVCQAIRHQSSKPAIPVIMLTAKSEESDRIRGFETGADDYVTKPFSPRELLLRIKVQLARSPYKLSPMTESDEPLITFGILSFDKMRHEVKVKQTLIPLTAMEFKILDFFLKHRGRAVPREVLLQRVWGYGPDLTTRTVDTHIKRLREKLLEAGAYIETVRGTGYKFLEQPPEDDVS